MDRNAIKKYAVWARRELISRVSQKAAQYEITADGFGACDTDSVNGRILSQVEKEQRVALIDQISMKGYEQVIEEVAYTWFNRFSALRFMEVNGYLPSYVRVFTDDENNFKPQILTEAINLELDGLDMQKIYDLKNANNNDELFKYLLITQCNALYSILPGMFQKIDDYTELLFPDNLLREGSVIEQMITLIPEDNWTDQVQIIGWLYQYYNSEPKDKVFADLKKNIKISKENIPAATQLFTPDWIVRYMVENSLGRLWIEGHPNEALKSTWKYYLDEAEQEPEVQAQLADIRKEYAAIKPEDILCIDPCQGSGHILAYMFDVLVQVYETYGYSAREAASSIVEHNLWGLDIDDRASQLAYFSVMMKARQYDARFFKRGIQPHIYSIVESNNLDRHCVDYFINGRSELKAAIDSIIAEFHDAKEYGSIIKVTPVDFDALYARFDEIKEEISIYRDQALESLLPLVQVAQALAQKYHAVITNPPYMGAQSMSQKLSEYARCNYPQTKSDLSTICMEKCLIMCEQMGLLSMINIPVWMFLSTYEPLRKILSQKHTYINMIHPGRGIFGSDFGTVTFVISRQRIRNYIGRYHRLFDRQGEVDSAKEREIAFLAGKGKYYAKQENYLTIPGAPVAYWASASLLHDFSVGERLDNVAKPKQGIKTADKDRFLRFWHEIDLTKASFYSGGIDKWFPCNKGGSFRKWYGNNEYVVNWENSGYEICNYRDEKGRLKSRPQNLQYMLREGITYTNISISSFGARYSPAGFIYDAAGSGIFCDNPNIIYYVLGFLTSNVAAAITRITSPTMSFEVGQISSLPFIYRPNNTIDSVVLDNIDLSKKDWDAFESSWSFQKHPLIRSIPANPEDRTVASSSGDVYVMCPIEYAFSEWMIECDDRFERLKYNEEELNSIFIDIYGLQEELSPEVEDKDVTVRKADLKRDIRSFISYATGCMLGRYSIDVPGIAYAGGEWDATKYKTLTPDADAILPICDDEYFEDDIVGRFISFVDSVYGHDTLEENLRFIADALGGSGTSREVIRNYFINDFYADHCKIYQKRPIYWLFDSGKKNGFKCLIYMHRYQPDTIARIRTDYVHEQQSRYRTAIADLENRISTAGTSERVKLTKQFNRIQDQAEELRIYEEKIHHLADQMISIDLDDGVKKNYAIFQDVLAKIK